MNHFSSWLCPPGVLFLHQEAMVTALPGGEGKGVVESAHICGCHSSHKRCRQRGDRERRWNHINSLIENSVDRKKRRKSTQEQV
jgi:hypothetical protein